MKKDIAELLAQYCDIAAENTSTMPQEEFAMIRRSGLGASDSSVILGLMVFGNTESQLIANKCEDHYTDEEKAIGDKVNVRKGRDLESLILTKAKERLCVPIIKGQHMYRIKEYPWLTINYDGLIATGEELGYPVEAKYTSAYGDKYWNYTMPEQVLPCPTCLTAAEQCKVAGEYYGIPPYYYAQLQQQMMGTGAPAGYMASLREKDWNLYTFRVHRNELVQKAIALEGYRVWQEIERCRNARKPKGLS